MSRREGLTHLWQSPSGKIACSFNEGEFPNTHISCENEQLKLFYLASGDAKQDRQMKEKVEAWLCEQDNLMTTFADLLELSSQVYLKMGGVRTARYRKIMNKKHVALFREWPVACHQFDVKVSPNSQ